MSSDEYSEYNMAINEKINQRQFYRLDDAAYNDSFDRILTKLHNLKREQGMNVIMVCGCQPSAGATTVAINLAIATAISGWKVLFIDADLRKSADHKRLEVNVNNRKQLGQYLIGEAEEEELLHTTNYPNLMCITGSNTNVNPINLFCSGRFADLLESLEDQFDVILIDAPSPLAAADANLIGSLVCGVILVAKWNETKTDQIQQTVLELEKSGSRVVGIIANQVDAESYKSINRNFKYFINQDYLRNYRKGRRRKNAKSKLPYKP